MIAVIGGGFGRHRRWLRISRCGVGRIQNNLDPAVF